MSKQKKKTSVRIRSELVMEIPCEMIETSLLSTPGWDKLNGCGGIVRDRQRAGGSKAPPVYDVPKGAKLPYDEHLERLNLSPQDPLVVIGARNLGNNLRIVAYQKGLGLLQLAGENADEGTRDYFCMCCMLNEKLEAHKLRFFDNHISQIDGEAVSESEAAVRWAISGQPLVWESATDMDLIIKNTYDLRHVWRIAAGEGERSQKGALVDELVTALVTTESTRVVTEMAAKHGLPRENDYLHSAIGLTSKNTIVIIQAHGSFEMIAEKLRNAGATHAIELEEGGSVSSHFVYKKGKQTQIGDSRIFASHYFRARASGLLVFKMLTRDGVDYIPTEEDSSLGLPTFM